VKKEGCICCKPCSRRRRLLAHWDKFNPGTEGNPAMRLCSTCGSMSRASGSCCRMPDCLICSHSMAVALLLLLTRLLLGAVLLLLCLVPAASGCRSAAAYATSDAAMYCDTMPAAVRVGISSLHAASTRRGTCRTDTSAGRLRHGGWCTVTSPGFLRQMYQRLAPAQ
jgi:hypothetical protein